jgi:large subunit ribosomal protein L12
MEYVYAALILNETGAEINEENLTNVLESAQVDVEESRVKALVAALEDIDIEEAVEQAAAVPAGGAAAPAGGSEPELEEGEDDDGDDGGDEAEAEGDDGGDDDEDEDASGEGLGELFG